MYAQDFTALTADLADAMEMDDLGDFEEILSWANELSLDLEALFAAAVKVHDASRPDYFRPAESEWREAFTETRERLMALNAL